MNTEIRFPSFVWIPPTPRRVAAAVPAAIALSAVLTPAAMGNDWPSWRGPSSSGSVASGDYPVRWNPDEAAWKVALPGKGASSPIVWKDRIFVSCPDAGENTVIAYDLDGRKLWQTALGSERKPKHQSLGTSCNASPVTDGEGLFVYFKSGDFAALEPDGSVRWRRNLTEEFGLEKLYWDQGSSPVVVDDLVVLSRLHGGESWVAGFDKATGEIRWRQPRDYDVPAENDNGYTTPVLIEHEGKKALLVWGADHLTAHAADSGRLLWSCGGFNPDDVGYWPAIATPVVVGGVAVVPVGRDDRNDQARLHGIRLGGTGDVTGSHREWKREDVGVFVATPAEYDGKVYLLRHRGGVVCLDPASGKTLWAGAFPRSSASYYSSPMIAGGVLYAAREDGVVFAARIEDGFELAGENDMGEQIIASPVPMRGRLLIRGSEHLFCIE